MKHVGLNTRPCCATGNGSGMHADGAYGPVHESTPMPRRSLANAAGFGHAAQRLRRCPYGSIGMDPGVQLNSLHDTRTFSAFNVLALWHRRWPTLNLRWRMGTRTQLSTSPPYMRFKVVWKKLLLCSSKLIAL